MTSKMAHAHEEADKGTRLTKRDRKTIEGLAAWAEAQADDNVLSEASRAKAQKLINEAHRMLLFAKEASS